MSEKNLGKYIEQKYKNKKKDSKVVVKNSTNNTVEPINTTAVSIPVEAEVNKENNPAEQNNPEVVVNPSEAVSKTNENQRETLMTDEGIKESLNKLDDLFNRLKTGGSNQEGFFNNFFGFFKKEQARDKSEINKISRKEGKELIQIKNKIENHKSKYENNLELVKDILSEGDKAIINQKKNIEDDSLKEEQKNCQETLDIRKEDLSNKYSKRVEAIETCLKEYNEINSVTSQRRMEISLQVWKAERAIENLKNNKQSTETLKTLREKIVEKLAELRKQELEINHRYKLVRQRIVKLQSDYFEAKSMLNEINNLGKTTHDIAKEIRVNREEAEKIRKQKEAEKKKEEEKKKAAEVTAAKEKQENQAAPKDGKEGEDKNNQVVGENKQEDQQDNQEKQEEGIDIKVLDEYLRDANMYFSQWNNFIVGSKGSSIYKDFNNFVKSLKNTGFDLKNDRIDGLKVRQLMIDFLKKEKMKKKAAEETVNNRLDKIRQLD